MKLREDQVQARIRHLLDQEALAELRYFWLSFCDAGRPAGQQFIGVCIVRARGALPIKGAMRSLLWAGKRLYGRVHGRTSGLREPTIRVGLVADKVAPSVICIGGSAAVENGIPDCWRACKSSGPSFALLLGAAIPKTIPPSVAPAGRTVQCACSNTALNWIARYKDSGSPCVYQRLTTPTCAARESLNKSASFLGRIRHATCFFI